MFSNLPWKTDTQPPLTTQLVTCSSGLLYAHRQACGTSCLLENIRQGAKLHLMTNSVSLEDNRSFYT